MPDKLIIFDYSGTLSLEACAFSRPDNLMHHLQQSGLLALGVDSADLFWSIVNETWPKGSTTAVGYKKVMQEGIAQLLPEMATVGQQEIGWAVSRFVDAYFDHSRIDEHWQMILQKLSQDTSVKVIIATDHYAEATAAIIKHFGRWNIEARPLTAAVKSNFIVANSADIGTHKAESKFWETVKTNCDIAARRILLIDDFGANEQSADAYSQRDKISHRRQKTLSLLEKVFSSSVECFEFDATGVSITDLIAQASEKITRYLSDKSTA